MGFLLSPLINIVINGGAFYLLTQVVEGISYTGGFKFFLLCGIVLGLINLLIRPLIQIISLPFLFISGALFMVAANVGILRFLSYFFSVAEFRDVTLTFPNWSTYVIGAIVFGIINWAANFIIK